AGGRTMITDEFYKGTLHTWELATGRRLCTFGTGSVQEVGWNWRGAFAANDEVLTTIGPDGTIRVWELATGKERCQFKTDLAKQVKSAALTPDAKTLFIQTSNGVIRQWDLREGKEVRQLDKPVAAKRHLIYGHLTLLGDGRILAVQRTENDTPNQLDSSQDN